MFESIDLLVGCLVACSIVSIVCLDACSIDLIFGLLDWLIDDLVDCLFA